MADPQSVVTPEDTPKPIVLTGSDTDGDTLTYRIVSAPSHGTLSGLDELTGELVYTPNANYNGPDAFVFEACDPLDCAQATVTITVTPSNDPPVASDQSRTTAEDTATGFFALAVADPDNTLAEIVCNCLVPPAHGTVERGPNHTVNYTPDKDFSGVDQFEYIVCDPAGTCDTATVTVTVTPVNDPPSGSGGPFVTLEDEPIDITIAAADPEDESLTFTLVGAPQHGRVEAFDPATGSATYAPEPGFYGPDSLRVEICDTSGGCSILTVNLIVIEANDAPVGGSYSTTVIQGAALPLRAVATDPDGDPLTYTIEGEPAHGRVTSFDPVTGELVYVSDGEYTGPDEIRFLVCDDRGLCDRSVIQLLVVRNAGGGAAAGCERNVVISEIAWAGTQASEAHEWIELRNLKDEAVDLSGWTLRWRVAMPTTQADGLWKTVALTGSIGPREPDDGLRFAPDEGRPGTWWVFWESEPRDDYFLIARGTGESVLHVDADLIYDEELSLDRIADFDDRGDVVELVDPTGCVVDTANAEAIEQGGWAAGSLWPAASMERTDALAPDAAENWHTNLGLVRTGMDAWGNLIHGTPKHENSPMLGEAVSNAGLETTTLPMGETILLRLDPLPEWPVDPELWRVAVTRSSDDELLEASWWVEFAENGDILVGIGTLLLPLDTAIDVWVRTPSGDLLLAPRLLYLPE